MKYEKALFIFNGNEDDTNMRQNLSEILPVLSTNIKELTTIRTMSLEELKDTCVNFAQEVELIIVLGGDGTLHECINSISPLEKRPVLAILPGGTCNDFSRTLNMPQNPRQAAEVLVDGEVVDIDVGFADKRYFLNFWGIGLISETSLNINETQKKNFGVLSYFMSTLKTVNQAESFFYNISGESENHQGEAVMILVMNGNFIGTRKLPIPSLHPSDGLLDVLVIKNSSIASFRELLSMNRPNTDVEQLSEIIHFQASSVQITTEQEMEIDMDGEIDGVTPEAIRILPGHLQMIRCQDNRKQVSP
ncbi:YegS/Rv2252/BmrU family lipid kinase [Virgibacillus siamensis]|uniref:YegS/Rv2252/BmrU family lipid kinase n=1 Tax=Virgibacillus siamensis TaxID=480071 RepID=UPI0009843F4E|nr:YegS/Rv2252/BmrU family lipid kinase [Virgibacillus siamensis]